MKNLIVCIVLALLASFSNAQEMTEMEEAEIVFEPLDSKIYNQGNSFTFVLVESYLGEFESDPISFIENHFDIEKFKTEIRGKDYDSFLVNFESSKGNLFAVFDKEGKRKRAHFKLKNVLLPANLRYQVYSNHKGWAMVKNVHVAKENDGMLTKEYYRIELEKDGQQKNIKIDTKVAEQKLANN